MNNMDFAGTTPTRPGFRPTILSLVRAALSPRAPEAKPSSAKFDAHRGGVAHLSRARPVRVPSPPDGLSLTARIRRRYRREDGPGAQWIFRAAAPSSFRLAHGSERHLSGFAGARSRALVEGWGVTSASRPIRGAAHVFEPLG